MSTTIDDIKGNTSKAAELRAMGAVPEVKPIQASTSTGIKIPNQQTLGAEQTAQTPPPAPKTYVEMLNYLNPYTPPTKEDLEKERKKQKTTNIIAALGDGIAALSNLYYTTQGAPNMYTGTNTLTGINKARYDKIRADRDAREKEYLSAYMKARQMDEQRANADRAWQHTLERDRIADERYASEQAYKKDKDEQTQSNWMQTFLYNMGKDADNANFREKQLAETREHHRTVSGNGKTSYNLNTAEGTYTTTNKADYDKAVMRHAVQLKIPLYDELIDEFGTVKSRQKKDVSMLAAEVEMEYERRKAAEAEEAKKKDKKEKKAADLGETQKESRKTADL